MRNMKLHTICILALGSILTMGFDASAQLDPNMEAGVDCSNSDCMFRGNSQVRDGLGGLQKLTTANGDAKLIKVNEYADNPEKVLNRSTQVRFQGIGMVQRERELAEDAKAMAKNMNAESKAGHGTAINIGPCSVLTNYHVPFGSDLYLSNDRNYKMAYNVGYSKSSSFDQTSELTPKVKGDLLKSDFSLSEDSKCSGSQYGWYKPSDISTDELVRSHARVLVVSFSGDQGKDKMTVSFGNVTGVNPVSGNVLYDASTSPGSSGGAVFIVTENGDLLLQGVHVGGAKSEDGNYKFPTYSDAHANEFINASDIMYRQDVRQFLRADFTKHPGSNPLESYLHVGH